MSFLSNFSTTFFLYIKELFIPIVIGFLLSGIIHEFIPSKIIQKYLGKKGLQPIFAASLIGTLLPICCFGTLPIAVTIQQKGARLGPVLAFLVTTPATSVSALMACWKLLGIPFTIYIFFAVIAMGLVIGILGNLFSVPTRKNSQESANCCHEESDEKIIQEKTWRKKSENVLRYALITLPGEIGFEILLGIAIASLVMVFTPLQWCIKEYLSGGFGYVFSLIIGLVTYVCSTASVPMADAFIKSGMSVGAAMVYLLAGPVTSYGIILAVRKEFGWKVLSLYISVISLLSLLLGVGFNLLMKLL